MNQIELLPNKPFTLDNLWLRAALKECIAYQEHGQLTEVVNGHVTCWNCGNCL